MKKRDYGSYYIVQPSFILDDIRLTATAREVYGLVDNLTHKTGVCFAGNDYMLNKLPYMGERTLQRALAMLEEYGYIKREIITESGKQNERKITLSDDWRGGAEKCGGDDTNANRVMTPVSDYLYDEKQSIKKYILPSRARVNEMFDKLWDAYPKQRRGSKQQAYDSFVHCVCADRVDPEQILNKLPEYVNSAEVADLGMVQYLYRWLENRGYESEYKPAEKRPAPDDEQPITMPVLGVRGCEIWTMHNLQFRNQNGTWAAVLRAAMDKYFGQCPADYTILSNIRTAAACGSEMARVIYFLGNGGDIAAVEREFVRQWWRRDAYQKIRRGDSTLDAQRALWGELCKKIGMTEFTDYDPAADFKHMDEFYNKMGWK
ncbi:MAG: helix-turn-helix domain-containing protein [Alphaproteobacteria bacterium]|nr:helix-turn-helix domain-containing protein [Alphaproteobacteria bacterium]